MYQKLYQSKAFALPFDTVIARSTAKKRAIIKFNSYRKIYETTLNSTYSRIDT